MAETLPAAAARWLFGGVRARAGCRRAGSVVRQAKRVRAAPVDVRCVRALLRESQSDFAARFGMGSGRRVVFDWERKGVDFTGWRIEEWHRACREACHNMRREAML